MPNRLGAESSPYLRQHKDNPVQWYPWGREALGRAREEDKPLLVSIGYSACHWCHVMAHESFEDERTAALMNERFVCIKVDREERPDIDALCMEACQALTGHGGWPLNAFLTPSLEPFYAGTYFPPEQRQGLPSWRMVLLAVADGWRDRRGELVGQAAQLVEAIGASARIEPSGEPIDRQVLARSVDNLQALYDSENGGFGGAPKFPPASVIEFLLACGETQMSLGTLRAMARGGIYDQIGGGFSRYAVDATWTVPHFEKMLYDNALLARAYLHGAQVSGDASFERVCRATLDWVLREMVSSAGGFYSALDADSEGVEGKYYVWTREQLGDDAELFELRPFEHGTFVLRARGEVPDAVRRRLYAVREQRVRPGLDDKVLTSWNALMISALAEAGAALAEPRYVDAAVTAAEFIARERRDSDGRLLRTDRLQGYLEDYAYLLEALLTLYESTFDPRWYHEAVALAEQLIALFSDPERGGFFTTAADHERLPVRRKDLDDAPIPSGNSAAAFGLLRLGLLSGESKYERCALSVLRLLYPLAGRHPQAFGQLLAAADFYLGPVHEVAIVGEDADALVGVVRGAFRPHIVLAGGASDGVPLLEGREPVGGRAAAYVCERFECQAPVTEPDALAALL
ncbi:MAG TPA: thioredoxin domain-containing protein [Solirubrobacteraceae bacterium]|nr:thioredoxin domain-containing protein [Solirubrobacteraceae bacterium]